MHPFDARLGHATDAARHSIGRHVLVMADEADEVTTGWRTRRLSRRERIGSRFEGTVDVIPGSLQAVLWKGDTVEEQQEDKSIIA